MARMTTPKLKPDVYEADAFYEVRFAKVIDLGDMRLRPAHDYPSIAGSLLAGIPADAIASAKKLVPAGDNEG